MARPIIHVDPRFTRTSANADIYAPLRPGTDITFLGGLINYVLSEDEILPRVRRAPTPTPPRSSARTSATPKTSMASSPAIRRRAARTMPQAGAMRWARVACRCATRRCNIRAASSRFSNATSRVIRRRWSSRSAARRANVFVKIAETLAANSGRDRTTAFCYALGWTQHTIGVQNIRAAAILQLLLGNIGRPGGGILALRGHAAIQGSTDIPTLYNLLPGYLNIPYASNRTLCRLPAGQSGGDWLVEQRA